MAFWFSFFSILSVTEPVGSVEKNLLRKMVATK
jgi:hypothetical protein